MEAQLRSPAEIAHAATRPAVVQGALPVNYPFREVAVGEGERVQAHFSACFRLLLHLEAWGSYFSFANYLCLRLQSRKSKHCCR